LHSLGMVTFVSYAGGQPVRRGPPLNSSTHMKHSGLPSYGPSVAVNVPSADRLPHLAQVMNTLPVSFWLIVT